MLGQVLENEACLLGKHFKYNSYLTVIFFWISLWTWCLHYSFHVNIKLQPHFIRITDWILSLVICWGRGGRERWLLIFAQNTKIVFGSLTQLGNYLFGKGNKFWKVIALWATRSSDLPWTLICDVTWWLAGTLEESQKVYSLNGLLTYEVNMVLPVYVVINQSLIFFREPPLFSSEGYFNFFYNFIQLD